MLWPPCWRPPKLSRNADEPGHMPLADRDMLNASSAWRQVSHGGQLRPKP